MADLAEKKEKFYVFCISGELYGVQLDSVCELVQIRPCDITDVPGASVLSGLITLHGAVIPLLNPRMIMGLSAQDCDIESIPVVVCKNSDDVAGFTTDTLGAVEACKIDDVKSNSNTIISRIIQIDNRPAKIISVPELFAAATALENRAAG